MSDPFGVSGLEFLPDPRVNGGSFPSPASRPEPASTPPPAPARPVESAEPVVLGAGIGGRLERILAGQPWYANPQPAYTELVQYAKRGDWTLSKAPRIGRLAWLWLPAMAARVGAWSILRVWMRANAPKLGGEQPAIRDVIAQARESGPGATAFVCGVYVPARIASVIADYAGRTAIAVLLAWLTANALNTVPGVELLIPDAITPTWWWEHVSSLWASNPIAAPNSPAAVPPKAPAPAAGGSDSPSVASIVGQLLLIAATICGFVWTKRRNKNTSNTPPWGGGSENR